MYHTLKYVMTSVTRPRRANPGPTCHNMYMYMTCRARCTQPRTIRRAHTKTTNIKLSTHTTTPYLSSKHATVVEK
jgi:hypothetical protein